MRRLESSSIVKLFHHFGRELCGVFGARQDGADFVAPENRDDGFAARHGRVLQDGIGPSPAASAHSRVGCQAGILPVISNGLLDA